MWLSLAAPLGAVSKTYALLLEPLRHVVSNPLFSAVFFRRTTTQITAPGGLWDAATRIYPLLGAVPRLGSLEWLWTHKGGGKIKMAHLEHPTSTIGYQGSEIVLLCFDELCHFEASQFWFMLSRNRSMSGVKGYIRATCNPDADSWVATFIEWWIDQRTGFPIPERSGVLRWMLRVNDAIHWADSRQEIIDRFTGHLAPEALQPKSVTFIPSKLTDNKVLMAADPAYYANLLALPTVERERLLAGNWRIRPSAGLYFQRRWLRKMDFAPDNIMWVRGWDLAGTPKTETNNPDFTESCLMGRTYDGRFVIADHTWMQGSPDAVQKHVLQTAERDRRDGLNVTISIPQDPAQAGKSQAADYVKLLSGYDIRTSLESRSSQATATAPSMKSAKVGRFAPFSAQCEGGNVHYIEGPWNEAFFDRLEAFPEASKDDAADATARAYSMLGGSLYDSSMRWVSDAADLII